MTLGRALKESRLAQKWSLRDLERVTEISNGYISLLESDSVRQPSPRHLHTLSKALGIDYGQLMSLAGYALPNVEKSAASFGSHSLGDELRDLTEAERREVSAFARGLRASRGIPKGK